MKTLQQKQIFLRSVAPYFDGHPTVDEFWLTSDGMAFFASVVAERHASNLEDRSIISVTRRAYDELRTSLANDVECNEPGKQTTEQQGNSDEHKAESKGQRSRQKVKNIVSTHQTHQPSPNN